MTTPASTPTKAKISPTIHQLLRHLAPYSRREGDDEALRPGDWMDQLGEALSDVGLLIGDVSYSAREIVRHTDTEARFLYCTEDDAGQLRVVMVRPRAKGRAQVQSVDVYGVQEQRVGAAHLARMVGEASASSPLHWARVSPARPLEALRTPGTEKPNAIWRLRRLVHMEGPTLRAVVLYALVVGIVALATPLAVQSVVNIIAFGTLLQPLVVLTVLLLLGLLLAGGIRVVETFVVELLQRRIFTKMAADVAHRLPRVTFEARGRRDLRELVNRFLEVASLQKAASSLLLEGVGLALQALVGLLVLAFYHPLLLTFDVVLVLLLLLILRLVGRRAVKTSIKESKAKYALLAWLQQVGESVPILRSGRRCAVAIERADQLTNDYLSAREAHFARVIRQLTSLVVLQAFASAALLGLGGWLVMRGELTLGQLVASELIVTAVVGSMAKFGKLLEQFYDAAASMDKLGELIDIPLAPAATRRLPEGAVKRLSIEGATLAYEGKRPILSDVDVSLIPGEHVAVVGDAGAGKSLLLGTLAGHFAPTRGEVRLGGEAVRRLDPALVGAEVRHLQDLTLVPGTLLENLRFYDASIREEQAGAMLELLGASKLLKGLPDGLHSRVVGASSSLSHDLRVQVCVSRELLTRPLPAVLLLDGVLDGISKATRKRIVGALGELSPAVMIASHHPDVIAACERVLRIEDGAVVEVPS